MSRGNKIRLSKSEIKKLQPREKEYFQGDSEVPTFGVMVTPAGNKSFYMYGTVRGKKIKKKIGPVEGFNDIDDVRYVAREMYKELTTPDYIRVEPKEHLVSQLWDDYRQHQIDKGTSADHLRDSKTRWEKYLQPKFGNRMVREIKRVEFKDFMLTMRDMPYQGNQVYKQWRHMFNRALDLEWIDANPFLNLDMFPEKPRKVALEKEEVIAIWHKTRDDDLYHLAFRMLILAGSRHKELFSSKMSWFEPDGDGGMIWTKPAKNTKSGNEHKVYLSEPAMDTVLRAMALAREDEGNVDGWLFPSRDRMGNLIHITTVDHVWNKIRDDLGFKGKYRLYDLRKTFATDLFESGANDRAIIQLTGHTDPKILHDHYVKQRTKHQKDTLKKLDQSFAK